MSCRHDWTFKYVGNNQCWYVGNNQCWVVCRECGRSGSDFMSETEAVAKVAELNGTKREPSPFSLRRRMREARRLTRSI